MENPTDKPQDVTKASKLTSKIKPLYIITAILLIAALFSAIELFKARQELKNFKTNPEAAATKEVQRLVDDVGKLIDLPSDETPTVATVTDPAKLKDRAFFTNAKEGDKVLIYNNAKKPLNSHK